MSFLCHSYWEIVYVEVFDCFYPFQKQPRGSNLMVWASHPFLSALSVRPQNAPTRSTVFKIRPRMILWCDGNNELSNSALENCLSAWKKKHLDSPTISKLKRFEFWLACWPKKNEPCASSCTTRYMFSSFFKIFQQPSKTKKTCKRPCVSSKKSQQKWGSTHKSPNLQLFFGIPTSNARSAMIRHGWTLKHSKPKQPTSPLVTTYNSRIFLKKSTQLSAAPTALMA